MGKKTIRAVIFLIIVSVILFFANRYKLSEYLNIETLKQNRNYMEQLVKDKYLTIVMVYSVIYFFAVVLMTPGAAALTVAGGYMFGTFPAALYINVAATLGAGVLFLIVRYFIGDFIQEKYSERLKKFNKEVEKNGMGYFLTVRFIPIFPFFIINLLAGLTKIKFRTFLWTTSIGIFPGSLIYAYAGRNLREIESLGDIMSKEIFFAFLALGLFTYGTTVVKKFYQKRKKNQKN